MKQRELLTWLLAVFAAPLIQAADFLPVAKLPVNARPEWCLFPNHPSEKLGKAEFIADEPAPKLWGEKRPLVPSFACPQTNGSCLQ